MLGFVVGFHGQVFRSGFGGQSSFGVRFQGQISIHTHPHAIAPGPGVGLWVWVSWLGFVIGFCGWAPK